MMALRILALCLSLLWAANGLEIAVNSLQQRCMIVYTTTSEEMLKMDIKFPALQHKNTKNNYSIELVNTETEETEDWTIESGTFRKEIKLTESSHFFNLRRGI